MNQQTPTLSNEPGAQHADLFAEVRRSRNDFTDAGLIDAALVALVERHRSTEIDQR